MALTDRFKEVFKCEKPIIGMLHLKGFNEASVIANAKRETEIMISNGVNAVLVENYFGSATDVESFLAVLQSEYRDVVYGVNILGDYPAAFRLANRYGASFIQVDSICGHLHPFAEEHYFNVIDELRNESNVLLLGGVRFKYQPVCSGRSVGEDLKTGSGHCDVIVVTGEGTGIATDLEKIKEFRSELGAFPLIVGAGMTAQTVKEQLKYSDGGIVGSYFKENGNAQNDMDEQRVKEFMKEARKK